MGRSLPALAEAEALEELVHRVVLVELRPFRLRDGVLRDADVDDGRPRVLGELAEVGSRQLPGGGRRLRYGGGRRGRGPDRRGAAGGGSPPERRRERRAADLPFYRSSLPSGSGFY